MPISVVFDPPLPSDSPSTFNTKAFTLLGDLNDWSTQANALPGEVATNLTTLLASPPTIGSTTPAAVSATTLSASGAVTLTAANPYISFVGTAATQNWRLGDGQGAVNGNLVLYDYTSSVKAIEVTKGTGAVTIPGNTGIGLANVGVSKLEVSKDNDTLLLSGATSGGGNTPGIAFRTNPNTPTSWTSAAIKAYDGGASYGAGLKFYVNSGTTAVAASTLAIDIAQTGAVTFNSGTFGYGTGAGGTVTQATSKSTAVTLNKPCGQITMNNAALAAGASVEFILNNTYISSSGNDLLYVQNNYNANYSVKVNSVEASLAYISVTNISAGSLSNAVTMKFAVVSGATS